MNTQDKRPFFLICGDPGGTNALVPVIHKLISEGKEEILVFAYRQAINIMAKNRIACTVLDEAITESEVLGLFTKNKPGIVITSTSSNSVDLEKKFIKTAKKIHIPSIAVLDFWSNYSLRFSDSDGSLTCVPDKIAIMDGTAHKEMVAEGFDPRTLVITGQPAFDSLAESKNSFSDETRQTIRTGFQIHERSIFVVFVSQPFSQIYGNDNSNPHYPGYTEKIVLKSLINSLEKISKEFQKDIVLLIRPHPRERIEDYSGVSSTIIKIIITSDYSPRDIVMASDVVTGMSTELLIEACYLGCVVISIQPGLRINDPLPTNKSGCSIPVYSEDKLMNTLKWALLNPESLLEVKQRLATLKQDGHASNRVIQTIYQVINAGS